MTYVKPWEDRSHEEVNIFLGSPKSHEFVEIVTPSDLHSPLLSSVMYSPVVATTRSLDSARIFEQFAVALSRISKLWEATIELEGDFQAPTYVIFPFHAGATTCEPENLTTANPRLEALWNAISQSMHKRKISDRFDVLAQREDNWDGYESKRPTQLILTYARHFMEELFDNIAAAGYLWIEPFISSDEDGYITAEWYEKGRQLHIQIGENETEYLQVWGINIDTEMREGSLDRDNCLTLWEWLLDG